MKKVLIIGNFWPFLPFNRGAGRIIELIEYLPDFGWQPIVITQSLSKKNYSGKFQVIEVPSPGDIFEFWRKIFKRLLKVDPKQSIKSQVKQKLNRVDKKSFLDSAFSFYQEIFGYPDTEKKWKIPALKKAEELIRKEKIDAIISEYPVISHIIAHELERKYNIPWIADFCDLWSQNHIYSFGLIRKYFDRKLEIKTLKSADAVVTVSQPWADKLKTIHKNKTICSIPHGFDPKIINNPPDSVSDKFMITYTGRIYSETENPEPFFHAIKELLLENAIDPSKLIIRFYGDKDDWVKKIVEENGLLSLCFFYDRLPKEAIIEKQRETQILLLFAMESKDEKGWHSLKIFDYLAAKRPILVTGGAENDVIDELINETKAGIRGRTMEEIKNIIKGFYVEYAKEGKVIYRGKEEELDNYSYTVITKKFVEILNQITKK